MFVCAGVYIAHRAAFALLQGVSTGDIRHVLTWHCLQRRHGVAVNIAIIVLDDILVQHSATEYVIKQTLLNGLKIDILPVLFAGVNS